MDVKVNMDKTKSSGEKVNFEIDVKILRQHDFYIYLVEVEGQIWYAHEKFDDKNLQNLHCACRIGDYDFAKSSIDLLQNPNGLDPVTGDSPLHTALFHGREETAEVVELLMRSGADPNSANMLGWTPLHIACRRDNDLAEKFLKICDELRKTVQIDAVDKLGYTPLRLAVSNFLPNHVKILLDRGADVSKFIFPTESYFGESFERWRRDDYKLRLVPGVLAVIECLERRGYELDQNGASTIMKFFFELKMFEKSVDLQECWYDDKDFASKARAIMIRDNDHESLSLYDLSRLPSVEAAKRLKYEDYYDFFCSFKLDKLIERHKLACTLHLCEKLSRGFFRRWALKLFMELTHYQLPILCCEKIIEKLMNQDLIHICLATTDQSH